MNIRFSKHADQRIRQRGFLERDIGIVLEHGSPDSSGGVMLLRRDADLAIAQRKREIKALERLCGCRVVVQSDVLITVYRPTRRTEKHILRNRVAEQ